LPYLFTLLDLELAGLVAEVVLAIAAHDYGKDVLVEAALGRVVVVAAVHEDVVLAAVAVEVTVHDHLALVQQLLDHFARVPNAREGVFQHGLVVAVEVAACEGAAVVADYHAVWVEHGHDFEDEVVAQKLQVGKIV
jgi:hypothetical protein